MTPNFSPDSREVLVTPPLIPVHRKKGDFEPVPAPQKVANFPRIFRTHQQTFGHVDWLSLSQAHPGANLPKINDGCVMAFDSDGEVDYTTLKAFKVEGSFESSVFLRCDGTTIDFVGNPSKWGRTDNVFGYDFTDCLHVVNGILAEHGLPPFSAGESFYRQKSGEDSQKQWTGCRIRRIDLTQNYATGSPEAAHAFLRWLAGQKMKLLKTGHYGDYDTVDFGRGSKRKYFKVYAKAAELLKHSKTKQDVSTFEKAARLESIEKIAEYARASGIVRAELTLKSNALLDLNCQYLGSLDMKVIEAEFNACAQVFTRANAPIDELEHLPRETLAAYRMWQAGDDVKTKIKKSQLYVHRKRLLSHGIDILIPSNVVRFTPPTRVITLSALTPPDWYSLPPVRHLRAA